MERLERVHDNNGYFFYKWRNVGETQEHLCPLDRDPEDCSKEYEIELEDGEWWKVWVLPTGEHHRDNKPIILKEISEHKNELMLDSTEVVRLIGFYEDEEDYYYEVMSLKNGRYYTSCVGGLTPLEKVLPDEDYKRLVKHFDLNIEAALELQKVKETQGPERVYVTWDPLLEKVTCVHRSQESWCDKCKDVEKRAQENRSYYPEGEWFEIQD